MRIAKENLKRKANEEGELVPPKKKIHCKATVDSVRSPGWGSIPCCYSPGEVVSGTFQEFHNPWPFDPGILLEFCHYK